MGEKLQKCSIGHDSDTENDSTTHLTARQRDSNWEKVRQEATCAICLELLDDPKSMPCLHTYCKKCLMEALAKRPHDPDLPQDRPAINCPLCRAEVALSDQGIESLPTNFSATHLVETVQLQDNFEQNKTQKCNSCTECDAIASCCECGGFFLCEGCFKVHKQLPSTKNHSMVSLNQLMQSNTPALAANKSLLCPRHPQELLKLFCEDCEELVCRDCVLVRHKTHNYNFIDDIIEKEKASLQDVTLEELQAILNTTQKAITGVEQMQAEVLSCNDQRVTEINKISQEIADMLNDRKRIFLAEVHGVTKDDLCPLQKQQEDLVTLKENIKSCHDFTQKILHDGTNTEIMSAKKQMLQLTEHLRQLHDDSPMDPVTKPSTTVFYQMDKIKEVVKSLGVVIDLQQCCIEDIPEKIYVDESVSVEVILKDTKGQPVSNASKAITTEVTLPLIDDSSVTSIVMESGDGKYSVIFTPKRYQNHIVSIQVNGHHISNSPVGLKVDVKHSLVTGGETKKASSYQPSVSDVFDINTNTYTRRKLANDPLLTYNPHPTYASSSGLTPKATSFRQFRHLITDTTHKWSI